MENTIPSGIHDNLGKSVRPLISLQNSPYRVLCLTEITVRRANSRQNCRAALEYGPDDPWRYAGGTSTARPNSYRYLGKARNSVMETLLMPSAPYRLTEIIVDTGGNYYFEIQGGRHDLV